MKVYVMRHGTTVWNEKGITQGRSNNRLSKSGKKLAEDVADQYKNEKFEVIFCSPLMRTMQTANIINKFHKVKIVKDDRLIEINQGVFAGRKKETWTDEEKQARIDRDERFGLEKYESVYSRAKNFIEDLKTKQYKNVLIVTHNVVASLIELILNDIDYSDKHLGAFKNAEIKNFNL